MDKLYEVVEVEPPNQAAEVVNVPLPLCSARVRPNEAEAVSQMFSRYVAKSSDSTEI